MRTYGDKKTCTYSRHTGKTWCRCCNGKYAKVGRKWRQFVRSLKKEARQSGNKEIRRQLKDSDDGV